jgi:hypothetical protein
VSRDRPQTTGILVVRAWTDDGHFRARVRLATDFEHPRESSSVATSTEQVIGMVTAWLDTLTPDGGRDADVTLG